MKAFAELEVWIKELGDPCETSGSNDLARLLTPLLEIGKISKEWIKHYEDTGPDNGPSLCEHDCADKMKTAFERLERWKEIELPAVH